MPLVIHTFRIKGWRHKRLQQKNPPQKERFIDNRYLSTASRLVRISGQAFGQRQNGCIKANRHELTDNLSK
jgi:hypothetical protein